MEIRRMIYSFLALACLMNSVLGETSLTILEAKAGRYLQPAEGNLDGFPLTSTAFSGTLSALLNLGDKVVLSAEDSRQINSIVKASPFEKPTALLLLTIAGTDNGILQSSPNLRIGASEDILDGIPVIDYIPGVQQIHLDTTNLQGCGEACLEQILIEASQELELNASYTEGPNPLHGKWTFSQPGFSPFVLNLEELSDRLVALEVASFWMGTKFGIQEILQRNPAQVESNSMPQILSRNFISPHMIRQAYGPDSEQYSLVLSIFKQLIRSSIQNLQTACKDRLVTLVVNLDQVSDSQQNQLWALIAPSSPLSVQRRKLLQSGSGDSDYVKNFIAWVSMWGSFFLLLFFALTGCHCLKSMKFKQDSLLYGKNKSD